MFLLVLLLICVSPGVIKVYQKRSTQTRDNYISNDVILLNARDRIGPVRFRKLFCTSRNWNYIYIYIHISTWSILRSFVLKVKLNFSRRDTNTWHVALASLTPMKRLTRVTPIFIKPLFTSLSRPAAADTESYCNKLNFNLTRLQTCSRAHAALDWTAAR